MAEIWSSDGIIAIVIVSALALLIICSNHMTAQEAPNGPLYCRNSIFSWHPNKKPSGGVLQRRGKELFCELSQNQALTAATDRHAAVTKSPKA
jgi:hypothetical protein